MEDFRKLSSEETKILDFLLQSDFPGCSELKIQLVNCEVKPIDAEGSIAFNILKGERANISKRIPVEAQFKDIDGIYVHILLHVVDGYLSELEIYKEDGSLVYGDIDINKLEKV